MSLFTEASWRERTRDTGHRYRCATESCAAFPAGKLDRVRVAGSRYGHQHLTGLHALVHETAM